MYSQCTKTQLEPAIQSGIIFVYSIRPSDSHLWQNWRLKQAKTLKKKQKPQFFFQIKGVTVEKRFAYIFRIYRKFGYKDQSILAPSDSVAVAT